MNILSILFPCSMLLFAGCAAHTALLPLGNGNLAPKISIGGPIVEAAGTRFPLPYLTAGVDYGVGNSINVETSLHLVSLAYHVAGVDVGATWYPTSNSGWRPTVGLGSRLFIYASTRRNVQKRFFTYPAISATAAWKIGSNVVYLGADAAIPVDRPIYDREAASVIVSPFLGNSWSLGKGYRLLTELKWQGANIETDQLVTGYSRVGRYGALAPVFAIQKGF